MNCPKTRELTPEEQIRAKITEVQGIIKGFQERIDEQNERAEQLLSILTSLNWKTTPESMQKKAVEAADSV